MATSAGHYTPRPIGRGKGEGPTRSPLTFTTALIKKVKVRWEPSIEFEDLLKEATFEYVGTRKAQAEARKAEKELLNNMATIQPGEEEEEVPEGE